MPGGSGLTWVVDPIDGTVNYLYGIRHYAVSIAVVEGDAGPGRPGARSPAVVRQPCDRRGVHRDGGRRGPPG